VSLPPQLGRLPPLAWLEPLLAPLHIIGPLAHTTTLACFASSTVQHTHAHHSTANARTDALFYHRYIHHTLTLAPGVDHIRLHDFPGTRRSLVNPSPAASSGFTITLALSNTRESLTITTFSAETHAGPACQSSILVHPKPPITTNTTTPFASGPTCWPRTSSTATYTSYFLGTTQYPSITSNTSNTTLLSPFRAPAAIRLTRRHPKNRHFWISRSADTRAISYTTPQVALSYRAQDGSPSRTDWSSGSGWTPDSHRSPTQPI
jgi:hypothetical protein